MRKPIWLAVSALVAAMMLLVACGESGSDDSDTSRTTGDGFALGAPDESQRAGGGAGGIDDGASAESEAPVGAPPPEPGNNSPFVGDSDGGGDDLQPVALQQIGDGRVIIYTSSMVVVVEDVSTATLEAQTRMAALGGLVFGQNTTTEPFPRTVLTFKVLPEDFQEALSRLADLGKLESQQVSTDDVTERVVDLESRIITAEASVERLREFLANATDLDGIAQIEAQLLQRETELERLRGQLRTIQDQAALATIFLTLIEPTPDADEARVELVQSAYLGHDDGGRCPGDDELTIDEDQPMTVCFSIENTGNLALTEIELRDGGLDLDEDDFTVLEGSLDRLAPGERLIGYFDATAELDRFPSPRFTAVVVDDEGEPIRLPIGVELEPLELEVIEDTSVPSFTEGLSGSWETVQTLGQVAVLAVGVAIPFFWVPLILVGLIWAGRRLSPNGRRPAPAQPIAAESEGGD